MIGWPSPRRKEELHRHVQRVYATLGAQASQTQVCFQRSPY